MNIVVFILVGIFSGWLAGQIWKGHGFGLIGNLVVGVVGSFIGGYVWPMLVKTTVVNQTVDWILSAVLGALILLFLINLIKK